MKSSVMRQITMLLPTLNPARRQRPAAKSQTNDATGDNCRAAGGRRYFAARVC
jgi:hypothetical protein